LKQMSQGRTLPQRVDWRVRGHLAGSDKQPRVAGSFGSAWLSSDSVRPTSMCNEG
jgi:hypothetical protein